MKRRRVYLYIAVFFLFFLFYGVSYSAKVEKPRSLNMLMTDIGGVMVEFFPMILSRRALSDKELVYMARHLETLSVLFGEA
nr:hypothetical protein [Gammaproteobacteria bacterium]NIX56801.1 hypothetical protein [candidate division Zixibacteria bacterium]